MRDSAHEKLFPLLQDPIPEVRSQRLLTDSCVIQIAFGWQVRASTVYCLGTFLANITERDDHVIKIDNAVASSLLSTLHDGSPIVRKVCDASI